MSEFATGDSTKTIELVDMINAGDSWLRHSGLDWELDWLLLRGASASELQEVSASWRGHIHHLRHVHDILVREEVSGFFKIIGVRTAVHRALRDDSFVDDDDLVVDGATEQTALPVRIAHSARALAALHVAGELKNPLNKEAITMFIRKASECSHWHNSADYRSRDASAAIAGAEISTVSQYQVFCRRNLRHEHMVPNNVIYRMILTESQPTEDWLRQLFIRFSKRATITRAEDLRLRRFDMPPEFFEDGHPWHLSPLARYMEKGLADSLEQRRGTAWML